MDSDTQNSCQELPECPYNCPYDPSKEEREEVSGVISEEEIEEEVPSPELTMTAIMRETDHKGELHFQNVWQTDFGPKVGVESKPEYSEVFNELDWEKAHHKWNSDRVSDTNMWEVDLDAVMYVSFYFVRNQIDVTIDDEVREKYLRSQEGLPLEID